MMCMSRVPCPTWTSKPGEGWRGWMNVRSISPPFVWFFSHLCFHSGSPACLMSLVSLAHQWPRWLHAATSCWVWCALPACKRDSRGSPCFTATAIRRHTTQTRREAAQHQLAEMSRIELNLAAAASPSYKLELIHRDSAKQSGTLLSSAGEMGPGQGSDHAHRCTNLHPRD